MNNSLDKCLGDNCRWFNTKPDNQCFFKGVLPKCSPELKALKKKTCIIDSKNCKHDDCQADKDYCCDCNDGDKYRSPDQLDWREER